MIDLSTLIALLTALASATGPATHEQVHAPLDRPAQCRSAESTSIGSPGGPTPSRSPTTPTSLPERGNVTTAATSTRQTPPQSSPAENTTTTTTTPAPADIERLRSDEIGEDQEKKGQRKEGQKADDEEDEDRTPDRAEDQEENEEEEDDGNRAVETRSPDHAGSDAEDRSAPTSTTPARSDANTEGRRSGSAPSSSAHPTSSGNPTGAGTGTESRRPCPPVPTPPAGAPAPTGPPTTTTPGPNTTIPPEPSGRDDPPRGPTGPRSREDGSQFPSDIVDLTSWYLTLPTGAAGDPDTVQPDQLLGYRSSYFELNEAGDGVVFTAPVDGATTRNSRYPRSELREMNGTDKASWSTASGTHELRVTEAVTQLPSRKPEIVTAQIHDADDDVMQIRLEGSRLMVQYDDGAQQLTLDSNYRLGTRYDIEIVAEADKVRVGYNGATKAELPLSGSGWYFKAGAYVQSNSTQGETSGAVGQVVLYTLGVTHR